MNNFTVVVTKVETNLTKKLSHTHTIKKMLLFLCSTSTSSQLLGDALLCYATQKFITVKETHVTDCPKSHYSFHNPVTVSYTHLRAHETVV